MFEFRSILCGTSLSEDDRSALCHALKIALVGRADLLVGHADDEGELPEGASRKVLHDTLGHWGLLDESGQPEAELAERIRIIRLPGRPEGGLSQLAARRRPDLLVLGTHQRTGLGRWVKPSIAEAMARTARLPTLFVPSGAGGLVSAASGELRLGRVLVPVAAWPDASRAAQLAQRLASTLGLREVRYRTLHVGQRRDAPTLDRMHDRSVWEHKNRDDGAVVSTILREADDFGADLVVMATEGHDSLGDRLLGSTVERVVREAGCPVLSAPPPL